MLWEKRAYCNYTAKRPVKRKKKTGIGFGDPNQFPGFCVGYYGLFSPSLSLPMWYVYLSLPVAGVLIIFYSSVNIIELLNLKKEKYSKSK